MSGEFYTGSDGSYVGDGDDSSKLTDDRIRELISALPYGLEIDTVGDPDDPDLAITPSEAAELMKSLAKSEYRPNPGQWAVSSGNYTMVGDTIEKLPPGFYDTASVDGQLFFIPMKGRTDKLIRFPHASVDLVVKEIEAFWSREGYFDKFRLPYKRGILLYGPPGSGKTCTLQLVARDVVGRGGIVLNYEPLLFLAAYRQVRRIQPDTPMVVMMEDLDAILESRNESTTLNILDGAERLHRVIFVATTNYPQKLGPRIVNRPSRFDKRIRVGHPDDEGRRMYIEFLIEDHPDTLEQKKIDQYVRDTKGMSLAHLKELFVATVLIGTPYGEALAHLQTMHLEKPTSADDEQEFDTSGRSYI